MIGRLIALLSGTTTTTGIGPAYAPGGALSSWTGAFPVGGSHGEFPDVFVRMENDDVHFGHVEADEGHRGAQAHRQTHGRNLNLQNKIK